MPSVASRSPSSPCTSGAVSVRRIAGRCSSLKVDLRLDSAISPAHEQDVSEAQCDIEPGNLEVRRVTVTQCQSRLAVRAPHPTPTVGPAVSDCSLADWLFVYGHRHILIRP